MFLNCQSSVKTFVTFESQFVGWHLKTALHSRDPSA